VQRAQILGAMLELAGERGYAGCSVESVITRAGVSRRTFYELFDGLQDCFLAVLDDGAKSVIKLVSGAFVGCEGWLDGLRWALASLLVVFDSEPLLARVWLVESAAAGRWALEHRERRLRDLLVVIREAWPLPDSYTPRPFVIEAVFASVKDIVVQRLIRGDAEGSMVALLGPLMGLVAAPFLADNGVQHEIERGNELARVIAVESPAFVLPSGLDGSYREASQGFCNGALAVALPRVLCHSNAHRVRLCLLFVAEHPGSSNSQVAAGIGVTHKGQISALLAHLAREGLVVKRAGGPGKRNRWSVSVGGGEAAVALRALCDVADGSHCGRLRSRLGNS
jgi:AcrR family transcriptional regulator